MAPLSDHPTVITPDGIMGFIEAQESEQSEHDFRVLVNFDNGHRLWVPPEALLLQEDGCYQLQIPLSELGQQHTRPTIHTRPAEPDERLAEASVESTRPSSATRLEAPRLAIPEVEGLQPNRGDEGHMDAAPPEKLASRVRLGKVVQAIHEEISEPILQDDVRIHRVPINEYVDEAPPIRYENDQVIIPITEEVLVVEKRLLVREELVVTKRQMTTQARDQAVRKREDVFAYPETKAAADERATPPAADMDTLEATYKQHYSGTYNSEALAYEYYQPAYHFGRALRRAQRDSKRGWEDVTEQARELWEAYNPETWQDVNGAIQHGFEHSGRMA